MKDMDEAEALHRAAAKAFAEAVETSVEHVVEVNQHDAAAFRRQVLGLAGRVGHSTIAEELVAARSTFRGELRQYSEKASQGVSRLREELDAAAKAMQVFAQGVSTSSGEHETVLRREFRQLERAATDATNVPTIRAAVHEAVHTVTESYEALKQAHNLVIAQLRDEIRVLQTERERSEKKPVLPEGIADKRIFDKQVEDLLQQKQAFGVLLAGVPDLRGLYQKFPQERVDAGVAEFVKALCAMAHPAPVSEHTSDVYAVTVPAGIPLKDWIGKLTNCHVFQHEGIPRTLRIEPRLELVPYSPGDSPTLFFSRLSQATGVITRP
jgi:hypothetical protein